MDFVDVPQARRILEALLSRGGDFGEIYSEMNAYTRIALDDGRLEEISSGVDAGVALRLVDSDRTFFASGNVRDPDSLGELALRLASALDTPERKSTRVADLRPVSVATPSEVKIAPGLPGCSSARRRMASCGTPAASRLTGVCSVIVLLVHAGKGEACSP